MFIFDEPTTGVDVGSKVEIYKQMIAVARGGAAVLFISSDFEELVGICDSIAVMRKGAIVSTHPAGELDVSRLMMIATGADHPDGRHGDALEAPMRPGASPNARRREFVAKPVGNNCRNGDRLRRFRRSSAELSFGRQFARRAEAGEPARFCGAWPYGGARRGRLRHVGRSRQPVRLNLAAGTVSKGLGTAAALSIGVGAGLATELVNAILVLLSRMPPFVATLGSMFVVMGLTLLYNGGQALTLYDQPVFFGIGQGAVGPIPVIAILLACLLAGLHILFRHTRAGLRMYAVGKSGGRRVARNRPASSRSDVVPDRRRGPRPFGGRAGLVQLRRLRGGCGVRFPDRRACGVLSRRKSVAGRASSTWSARRSRRCSSHRSPTG